MSTNDNLKVAFAGESQANRKYLAFAEKAGEEGKNGLAKIFKAAAEGETVHALNHLGVLAEVKASADNLKVAIEGETYEIESMYPRFIEEAEQESNKPAQVSFMRAEKVEEIHQELFREALAKEEQGEIIEDRDFYVCRVCGYPSSPEAPEVCPICGAPKEKFKKVE